MVATVAAWRGWLAHAVCAGGAAGSARAPGAAASRGIASVAARRRPIESGNVPKPSALPSSSVAPPSLSSSGVPTRKTNLTIALTPGDPITGSRAVSLNQVRRVRLEESAGRYVVEKQAQPDGGDDFVPVDDMPASHGELDSRISLEFRPPGEGLSTGDAAGGSPAESAAPRPVSIAFYPDGTADAGAIVLRDRQGHQLLLRINPVTARVRVEDVTREGLP